MKCLQVLKVCKAASERFDYAFDFTREFAILWEPNYPYTFGSVVRPNQVPGTGLQYTSSGGISNGEIEPEWSVIAVQDGSILWTPQAFTVAGLRHRIAAVTWTPPAGITISDQSEQDHPGLQEARIWVSGGTRGRKYVIIGVLETIESISLLPGAIYELRLEIRIE